MSFKHFITFCAGKPNYYEAGNRLIKQATTLNLFHEISCYTEENLKSDFEFWEKHSNFIENNPRGYGYWLWKPYVIKKTMEKLKNGDILLYLDCGCEIDITQKEKIHDYLQLPKNELIIACGPNGYYAEKNWQKMDLLVKMDMVNDGFMNSPHREAGMIMFLVCNRTIDFVNQWYELACDYHNIDDSPSERPNDGSFVEHRHDQSIFSLLTKKYDLLSQHSLRTCIDYARNLSGVSKYNT